MKKIDLAESIVRTLESPNECDSNLEAANVVDALYFVGRAMNRIAKTIEPVTIVPIASKKGDFASQTQPLNKKEENGNL